MAAFFAVLLIDDLPEEWKKPWEKNKLAEVAEAKGFKGKELTARVVFSMPECGLAWAYSDFVKNVNNASAVPAMLECTETWIEAHPEGVQKMKQSFIEKGHPFHFQWLLSPETSEPPAGNNEAR